MDGLQTWVINLDRAPDRLARISEQLSRLGLPFTRLAAVDGRALTSEQQRALDEPAFRRKHGMPPLAGELGCYLSHVAALRAFQASDAAFALILEDDIQLHDELVAVLRSLIENAARWDVAKLSAVHSGTPQKVLQLLPGCHLAVMLSRCTGASAYLVNRKAAESYLHPTEGLLPMSLPYDHVFDQSWRFGIKFRLVTPTPCGHDDQVLSTIGTTSSGPARRKFHWTQRLSTYRYRLGNELRRLVYGLASTWQERRGR